MCFINKDIYSVLPKINKLHYIAKCSKNAAIGITESKLDKTVCNSEVTIDGYNTRKCCEMKETKRVEVKLVALEKTFFSVNNVAVSFFCNY